jgi:hypothetical protein
MAENSEFFTAVSGSPSYSADSVCKWLYDRLFQGDGILKGLYNSLAVTSDGAGNALIATGSASKTGHGYYNDSVLTKALTLPASGYTNINTLVVRVDSSTSPNIMHVVVLVGSSVANGSTPTAPSITLGSDVYLADIKIVNTVGSYAYTVTDQRVYMPIMPANSLLGANWETALRTAGPNGSNWTTALAAALGSNWTTALAADAHSGAANLLQSLGSMYTNARVLLTGTNFDTVDLSIYGDGFFYPITTDAISGMTGTLPPLVGPCNGFFIRYNENSCLLVLFDNNGSAACRSFTGAGWGAWTKIWTAANDGSGSTMDTDLVRGVTPTVDGLSTLARSSLTTSGTLGTLTTTIDFTYRFSAASTCTTPASPVAGQRLTFINTGAWNSTINAYTGHTIGHTTSTSWSFYAMGDRVTFEWDGTSCWEVIETNGPELVVIASAASSITADGAWHQYDNPRLNNVGPGIYDVRFSGQPFVGSGSLVVSIGPGLGVGGLVSPEIGSRISVTLTSRIILASISTIALYGKCTGSPNYILYDSDIQMAVISAKRIG